MRACSFLIESSSKWLVTWTGVKTRMSLISSPVRLLTLELLALELRNFNIFELEYLTLELLALELRKFYTFELEYL